MSLGQKMLMAAANAGPGEITVSYEASTNSMSSSSGTWTWSSAGLGTASSDRYIVAAFHLEGAMTSSESLTSCTIAGVTATVSIEAWSDDEGVSVIAIAAVPTGTTGNIAWDFTGTATGGSPFGATWALTGDVDATALATASDKGASPHNLNVNTAEGGAVFAVSMGRAASPPNITWAGVTEDAELDDGTISCAFASASITSASTPLTVTGSYSGSDPETNRRVACSASFQPS